MRGLGIHCSIKTGRPLVVVTLADDSTNPPTLKEVHRYLALKNVDLAQQLADLGSAFSSFLAANPADAVVVKQADFDRRARISTGTLVRANAEGVILSTARRQIASTVILNGPEIATACQLPKKADVESLAASLHPDGDSDSSIAALAALHP